MLASTMRRTFSGLFRFHQFAKGHRHIRLPVHAGLDPLLAAGIIYQLGPPASRMASVGCTTLSKLFGSIKFRSGSLLRPLAKPPPPLE